MDKLSLRPLSAELAEKAKTELNENPEKIPEELEALRSWLSEQPHINARTDDQFLITFLRGCKYNQEWARIKIENFYKGRAGLPKVFQFTDITPKMQENLSLGLVKLLPMPDDKTGASIILARPTAYDPSKMNVFEYFQVVFLMMDMLLQDDDRFVVSGQVYIVDGKGIYLGHLLQLTPSLVKKATALIQKSYPMRLKAFHIINMLPIFNLIFKFFYSMLSRKLKKRIFLHDSLESLHKHINKDLLPTEYGGAAGSRDSIAVDMPYKIMKRREWFIQNQQYKMDESKRPTKPKKTAAVRSYENLEID